MPLQHDVVHSDSTASQHAAAAAASAPAAAAAAVRIQKCKEKKNQ